MPISVLVCVFEVWTPWPTMSRRCGWCATGTPQPAALSARKFRLTCSELNGRYTSNKFNMEVRSE